jgi:hypothetical protein
MTDTAALQPAERDTEARRDYKLDAMARYPLQRIISRPESDCMQSQRVATLSQETSASGW